MKYEQFKALNLGAGLPKVEDSYNEPANAEVIDPYSEVRKTEIVRDGDTFTVRFVYSPPTRRITIPTVDPIKHDDAISPIRPVESAVDKWLYAVTIN